LLRQIVSVLPMILACLIFVYIVTRFRRWWFSVSMFIVMLLIPGVVLYNQHFWHPDALMVLFVALTFYYLNRDRQRFGRDFYYAAVMCALAAATKLFGFFFFLAIAVYLITGLIRKILTLKKMILAGLAFVLVMGVSLLMSSPFLLVPSARQTMVMILSGKTAEMETGYNEPDPEHVYRTGLDAWMPFFEIHYTQDYFFYFLFGALLLGSFLGSTKDLNRLLLAWGVVVAGFLIFFIRVKSPQYQLALFLPLYAGGFLFPSILNESAGTVSQFLQKPSTRRIIWGLTATMIGSQFLFNLWAIFTSAYVRVYF
jgi:4-amino-4-deoxy-L-arabinose transferase-like glycosyltransferase